MPGRNNQDRIVDSQHPPPFQCQDKVTNKLFLQRFDRPTLVQMDPSYGHEDAVEGLSLATRYQHQVLDRKNYAKTRIRILGFSSLLSSLEVE
jgi:hypothetical protein